MHHKFIPDITEKEVPLGLISMSLLKHENDHPSILHAHEFFELIYFDGGEGIVQSIYENVEVKSGDVCLIMPYVLHTEISAPEKPLTYYVICFGNVSIKKTGDSDEDDVLKKPLKLCGDTNSKREYEYLFKRAFRALKSEEEGCGSEAKACLQLMVSKMLRENGLEYAKTRGSLKIPLSATIDNVKSFIDSHYSHDFKMNELAVKFAVSESTLNHSFKKEIGVSPLQYKIGVMLAEASALLKNSDLNVLQIAESVGFSDPSFFTKTFKKKYGLTPKEYRNNKESSNYAEYN